MNKIKTIIKENVFFIVFYTFIIGYYIYRMYSPAIWNDEIYTYTFFASRGVLYSITHYASNNHLLFTILSCFLRWFLPYIALRGVSLISSVLSVLFLYLLLKKMYTNLLATLGCMVFCWSFLTNFFALQGRGYALATLFLILTLWSGYEIVYRKDFLKKKKKKLKSKHSLFFFAKNRTEQMTAENVATVETESDRKYAKEKQSTPFTKYHVVFMVSLFCGMYTIISSGFWALPVCLSLGFAVLFTGRYERLKKLILAAVIALGLFVLAYVVMIASIGALAIRFTDGSVSQVDALKTLILHPLQSFEQGMQGIMDLGFFQHFKLEGEAMRQMVLIMFDDVIRNFLNIRTRDSSVTVLLVLSVVTMAFVICTFIKNKKEGRRDTDKVLTGLVVAIGLPIAVVLFWMQSMETFTRVFSYMGVYMAFLFVFYSDLLMRGVLYIFAKFKTAGMAVCVRPSKSKAIKEVSSRCLSVACFVVVFACFVSQMLDPYRDCEYDENEQWAIDAIENIEWGGVQTFGTNDVYANYQTKFWRNYVAKEEVTYDVDNPDIIIISPKQFNDKWPFNISVEENARLEKSLAGRELIYDNGWYEVYK